MVGAIADWFAVTALFKHPLGIPIPHTALVPNARTSSAAAWRSSSARTSCRRGSSASASRPRPISLRIGEWLEDPAHVRRVVDEVAEVAALGLSKVRDDHVEDLVRTALVPRFREEPISPLLGGLLAEMVADDLHHGLVDLALDELHGWLRINRVAFTEMLSERAPWWAPPRVNEAVTNRIHLEVVRWVEDIRSDPQHHARGALDSMLAQLARDLLVDPETRERTERLKERLLDHPAVLSSSVSLWKAFRRALLGSLQDPTGAVRARLQTECRRSAHACATTPICASGSTGSAPTSPSSRSSATAPRSPPSSPTPSSAGTARRPRGASSCTSGATCSSSASTARSSAAWSAC